MIRFSISDVVGKSDCLIVPFFEGKTLEKQVKDLDTQMGGYIAAILEKKDFEGKKGQISLLYPQHTLFGRMLLVGLGKEKQLNTRGLKHAIGSSVIAAQGKKAATLQIYVSPKIGKRLGYEQAAQALVVATEVAAYAFDEHKEEKTRVTPVVSVSLFIPDMLQKKQVQNGIKEGQVVAGAVNMARHLGNINPSIMTPTLLAKEASALGNGKSGIVVHVLGKSDIKKLGMGCLLGVASGSLEEPKFIILEYNGIPRHARDKQKKSEKPTVLVGKGITFDSGGLSLKPGNYMNDMKFDMLGAATVLGTIQAAAGLQLKKHIVGLIPTCENMPSGSSYRPDDILVAMNGKSVLVENTDAEGRLILADALSYATMKYTPKEVIDFATLTGACLVAIGNERSGLFGTSDTLIKKLIASAETVGEQLWYLPIGEEFTEAMMCEVADIKNIGGVGNPRNGGASTAAAFLQFFTQNETGETPYPWAHIDLSCSYYGGTGKAYIRGGANGFGVETMVAYLQSS